MKGAGKEKERITLMLLGGSNGDRYDPFVVFKTQASKIPERARENMAFRHGFGATLWREVRGLQTGVQIYENNAGWWNGELTIQVLLYHFLNREDMHTPVLLLLDDFSGHWREDVFIMARFLNVELMRVPAGYTSVCQPADISWNKPLKDFMRKNWVNYLLQELRNSVATIPFKLKPPTRPQIIEWTKAAWQSLLAPIIISGFRKANFLATESAPADPQNEIQMPLDAEPDWEELNRLLEEVPVVHHFVDSSRDIDTLTDDA
ncbi:hypothetical protein V7S43_019097 [Phytophthora oleae]|uniref:DDE-1 domain-containing protein n=1 Tax=Phytophthora oleae TaxID=2107226 RepID=A0ABD3EW92_9STRA